MKHNIFPTCYYLTEKLTKSTQWRRELFRSNVLLYLSLHKQNWEGTISIFQERS